MKRLSSVLGILVLAFGFQATTVAADQPTVIRIAYSGAGTGGKPAASGNVIATVHQLRALEKEFEKDGIKIQWNFFPGAGPATNEALAAKLIDFASQGDLPMIVARSNGLRTKILLVRERFGETVFVVPSDSTATSLADLKGKRIAVQKGTAGQVTLSRVLEKYGLIEKDFRILDMNNESTRTALATRDIDGTIISPYDLEARGIGKRLLYLKDPKVSPPGNFWVTEEFEAKYPEIVQRVVNTFVRVAVWSSDEKNRTAQFNLWTKSGTPYIDLKESWKGDALRDRLSPLLDEYYYDFVKRSIAETKKFGFTRREVVFEGWIEPKYLRSAIKEQKLEGFWDEFDAEGKRKPKSAKVAAQ